MNQFFVKYLFNHHYFVSLPGEEAENIAETRLALANLFNIRITEGAELLRPSMIRTASQIIGTNVPDAFYLGFPESVRSLSVPELLIDQLLHYYNTYGLDHFDEAGHSLFEEDIERKAFNEQAPVKDFAVLTRDEATEKLREYTEDLLSGSRQLSDEQYRLVLLYIQEYDRTPENCASKNTAFRLLIDTGNTGFAKFLMLSDVPKLADELNYRTMAEGFSKAPRGMKLTESRHTMGGKKPTKLNLKNRDRKLLSAVIDKLIADGKIDTKNCFEKKALWSGLLHHIHYRTDDPKGVEFVNAMRGDDNHSALSEFERILAAEGAPDAAAFLVRRKGAGMLLRNLDYLLSRCRSDEEVREVIGKAESKNNIILIQLLLHYHTEKQPMRTFKFVRHGMMRRHSESSAEAAKRKTLLSKRDREAAAAAIRSLLEENLKGRLGKVYIAPEMKNNALPLQEGAARGGFGTLCAGTRIPLPKSKKIRAFTYWEKVNDIDLSVIGLDKNLNQHEFSWRTMASQNSDAITFSGDQVSGFNGGSEFFDIDPDRFRELYPDLRYLVFSDNVFSGGPFSSYYCRAGYMLRDIKDSGEIFEPKTVRSSFVIDCDCEYAFLFGLDLSTNDFVWLNIANDKRSRIAGLNRIAHLKQYFEMTGIINVYDFFSMMASEQVDDPKEAEIAVTDEEIEVGENTEIIRSYDAERLIALLNG